MLEILPEQIKAFLLSEVEQVVKEERELDFKAICSRLIEMETADYSESDWEALCAELLAIFANKNSRSISDLAFADTHSNSAERDNSAPDTSASSTYCPKHLR